MNPDFNSYQLTTEEMQKLLLNHEARLTALESAICALLMSNPDLIRMPDILTEEQKKECGMSIAMWVQTTANVIQELQKLSQIDMLERMFKQS